MGGANNPRRIPSEVHIESTIPFVIFVNADLNISKHYIRNFVVFVKIKIVSFEQQNNARAYTSRSHVKSARSRTGRDRTRRLSFA